MAPAALTVFGWWWLKDDENGARDRLAVIVWLMISLGFTELFSATTYFPGERLLFNREQDSRFYMTSAYVVATAVAHSPHELIGAIGTACICYWPLKFQHDVGKFFVFILVCILQVEASSALGVTISMLAPSYLLSNLVANLLFDLWLLFSGYFLESSNIPKYFKWAEYSSFIKYATDAVVQNDFRNRVFQCGNAVACSFPSVAASVALENGTSTVPLNQINFTCYNCFFPTGLSLMTRYGFNQISVTANIVILLGFAIAFRLFSYLALRLMRWS